jgi:hypothetical protein
MVCGAQGDKMKEWVEIERYANCAGRSVPSVADMLNRYGVAGEHYRDERVQILVHARKADDLAAVINAEQPPSHEVLRWEGKDLLEWSAGCEMVYLVTTQRYVKIGVARNPESRVASMQVGCPTELYLWGLIMPVKQSARSLEYSLHRKFAEEKVRGEWFSCSVLEISGFTQIDTATP